AAGVGRAAALLELADRLLDIRRGLRPGQRTVIRQVVGALEPVERGERIARRRRIGAIEVAAGLDPAADHDAEHEDQADDDGPAEEQVEDLATVEADLDLVLVELGLATGHAPASPTLATGKRTPPRRDVADLTAWC